MARRSNRRTITDKLNSAATNIERAESLLAEATQIYFDQGAKEGALLDTLREGVEMGGMAIRKFRKEIA